MQRSRRRRVVGLVVVLVLVAAALGWRTVARKVVALVHSYGDIGGLWDCDSTAKQDHRAYTTRFGCFVPVPGHNVLAYRRPSDPDVLTFLMGAQASDPEAPGYDPDASEDEAPPHRVTIEPFWIQRHEVSVEQYEWCVRLGPCLPEQIRTGGYFNYGAGSTRQLYPANGVTWEGARAYCEWIGGRLPTEAEWEYVARQGPLATRYVWGDTEPGCGHAVMGAAATGKCGVANSEATGYWPLNGPDNSHQTVNVIGNVWEWVADWYGADYYAHSPAVAPRGPETGEARVQRGGGWGDEDPAVFRGAFRGSMVPSVQLEDVGFRCAADRVDHVVDATREWMDRYRWDELSAISARVRAGLPSPE
ncbi:MAG: formylglycine-generating enzyme family protein [Deltaproteobacteria bacterium]|nr:formylglycine-generating enzyme family protein [Deltaproteobacteria bacterium]MCB9785653.1 formylglycine-generating enzyme family protein [Deltaproteobacteria bacterium]